MGSFRAITKWVAISRINIFLLLYFSVMTLGLHLASTQWVTTPEITTKKKGTSMRQTTSTMTGIFLTLSLRCLFPGPLLLLRLSRLTDSPLICLREGSSNQILCGGGWLKILEFLEAMTPNIKWKQLSLPFLPAQIPSLRPLKGILSWHEALALRALYSTRILLLT